MYKKIKKYENLYEINEYGQVRNKNGRPLTWVLNTTGVPYVTLSKNGTTKTFVVAVLVAEHFVKGKDKTNCKVQHLDLNKQNNYYKNLKWSSHSEIIKTLCDNGKFTLNHFKCGAALREKISKKVNQYDLDGTFIKQFEDSKTAEKCTGIRNEGIRQCCRNQSKTSGGFIWKYN